MTDAPDRIWTNYKRANDYYCSYDEPPAGEFDDCRTEYVRADLVTPPDPFNPPKGQIDSTLWFWRCKAESATEYAVENATEAKAMRDEAIQLKRKAEKEVEAMGRRIATLEAKLKDASQ